MRLTLAATLLLAFPLTALAAEPPVEATPSAENPKSEKLALFEAAMTDYSEGRCEAAIPPLKTLVASGFRSSDAAMALRACYDKLYGIEGAVAKLREEVKANPEDAVAHSNLGVFLMFQLQWEEAQREILTALKLNPADIDAKLNLAWWYAQVGQSRAAIKEHQAILAIDAGNRRSLVELCTLIADRENDPKRALPWCEQAAAGMETNEIAGVTLGVVRMRNGDKPGAEEAFRRVVEANPKAATAHISLAMLRMQDGDLDGAQTILASLLAATPDDLQAKELLARIHAEKRDFTTAISLYSEVYAKQRRGMVLGALAKVYLQKYFFFVIFGLLAAMALLLWKYLNVRVPEPPRPANAH